MTRKDFDIPRIKGHQATYNATHVTLHNYCLYTVNTIYRIWIQEFLKNSLLLGRDLRFLSAFLLLNLTLTNKQK